MGKVVICKAVWPNWRVADKPLCRRVQHNGHETSSAVPSLRGQWSFMRALHLIQRLDHRHVLDRHLLSSREADAELDGPFGVIVDLTVCLDALLERHHRRHDTFRTETA